MTLDPRGGALQHLTGRLAGAATPEEIARLAVTDAADLIGAAGAGVFSRTGATLTALHSTGWEAEIRQRHEQIPVRRGRPLSDAVLEGVPVWLENAQQWRDRYPEMAPTGTSGGFQATACLPMRVEDRDLGALVFSFRTPRAFSADERAYLQAVTALCAQALDRARLLVAERDAREAAERQLDRMTFLARAGRLLEAPLSVEQRLRRFADLAVPAVADWCAIHLVRDDHVEQVAVAHSDPEKLAIVARLQERYPPDPDAPSGAIHVSRTGEPSFFPEVPDELIVASAVDDEHLALARSIGIRSVLIVPLLVRGRSLGALTLVHAESGRRFDELDLTFAEQLAGNAAFALDNARLYEQQRAIAETLQAALLPAALPDVPGLGLAARYRAQSDEGSGIQVGGDLYDVVATPQPGCWAFLMADVCGKGPQAAALTALIRHTTARRDRPRPPAGRGAAPAQPRDADRDGRGTRPVRDRRPRPARGRPRRRDGGARQRRPPAASGPSRNRDRRTGRARRRARYPARRLRRHRADRGDRPVGPRRHDGAVHRRCDGGAGREGFYGADRLTRLIGSSAAGSAEALADELLADVVAFQDGRLRDDVAILVLEAAP